MSVSAATSYYDLFENSSPVDETAQSISLTFDCQSTSNYTDFNGASYTGTGTYTGSGSSSTTVSGTVSLNGQTATASKGSIGTVSNGFGALTTFNSTLTGQTGTVSFTMPASGGSGDTASTGTISINATHGGSMVMHYKIPYMLQLPYVSGGSIDPSEYYGLAIFPSNITTSSNLNHVTHFCITSANGTLVSDNSARPCYYALGSELLSNNSGFAVIPIFIEFDDLITNILDNSQAWGSTITFSITPRLRKIQDSYQSKVGNNVTSDIIAHELQEESNAIQEEQKDIEEDTNNKITDFFGSFFSNLIGVFVPESGYFEIWFNRVNTMLADKLGILYYPFNLFISFIQELVSYFSEQQNSCVITFPEISFTNRATNETYVFLQEQQVDLGTYSFSIGASANSSVVGANGWTTPVQIIRRLNSIVLFFLFLGLLRQKLNLIIRGEDKDS